MKKILTLLSLMVTVFTLMAQEGEISGKITDENGEGVPIANVVLVDAKGISTGRGANTDFDGNYSIKPLTPGKYNIQVSYVGYAKRIEQGVVVNADKTTWVNIQLKPSAQVLNAVEIVSYKVPLIDPGKTSSQNTVTAEEIANMPTRSVTDIAATTSGAFQSDQGGGLNIKGGRADGTQYYVDGVKVIGTPALPATAIQQLQVITGGIPAKYGDLTGGIVNITTKGPSDEFHGGVEVQTSQGLDAYGYNLVNANVTGPLWKAKKTKKTILGFFAAFEYQHDKDPEPSAIGVWQLRSDILDSLRRFPLIKKETATGFNLRGETVTYADMYKQKAKPNMEDNNYRGTARLDIRPVDNITLALGGSVSYRKYHEWVNQYTLFNAENNPIHHELDWRVFARFTHNIQSKQSDDEAKKKSSAFQNAYYSVQFDYEKYMNKFEDETHQFNPFNYGYIGKFESRKSPVFAFDTFAIGNQILQGWKQVGFQDTAVLFTPGTLNAYGTTFTQQYYQLLGAQPNSDGAYEVYGQDNLDYTRTITDIESNKALINGQRSDLNYNIWYNTGRQYNGMGYDNTDNGGGDNDQYRVRLEGAFDILKPGAPSRNKHSFEFGVEFEQRILRQYQLSPLPLWDRARQLANAHLTTLDFSNPTLVINGQPYAYNDPNRPGFYLTDTILFNRAYSAKDQTFFDKSLRQALGKSITNTDWIDVDALSPSFLKLNMFSPDDLLGDGSSLVSYRGYDPYGNRLTSQPSFYDFFTKKRADGEYERPIAAFQPIYTAAYISDRFYFKDLTFNVGVRLDRFDANQPVLKDEYSLYAIKTASEVTSLGGKAVAHPADIGGDYFVYVNDKSSPSSITGYRQGDRWFDRYGTEISSGKEIALASGGSVIPYLEQPNVTIKDSTYDPHTSFQDYKPSIIVMPRLQFSFNITDKALFFAHYDILSQRPNSRVIMDPTQYYFFTDQIGAILNNPNLKPEKTIDFELGFKQKVSNTAAVTISAFYREFRDQIQLEKIYYAYPKDYITYGNIDFGTTKGFALDFDMRRTGNISLKANYTMQFAEGTGSDDQSQLNLVNANQPNFRSINPLNYDARHTINLSVNYEYGSGKDYNGPVVKNRQILANSGINFQFLARSGTPYTEQVAATPEGLFGQPGRPITEGSINGARKPWYFRLNMRVWKNFDFVTGKKKDKKDGQHEFSLQIYLEIQNLLNTQNVINVYRYTGTPDDDGYLSDPATALTIQNAVNPQSYRDLYAAYINNPDNYSLPRRIFLGASFNF